MSTEERFVGKDIPASEFGGDEGSVDPAVLAALRGFADQSVRRRELLEVLADSRVFVPVTAVLDSSDIDEQGHKVEKDSHMATVSMQTADGRRGLLAFTSIAAFNEWDAESRPVPARMRQAAAAAIDEGADALVIDVANQHRTALTSPELTALANGESLNPAAANPVIAHAISAAIVDIGQRFGCQFELTPPLGGAAIRLNLLAQDGLDPRQILQEVAAALQADDYLRTELAAGVEL
ncbi:MAG: SseB family protein, partial [Actinobacteria bacterium]|nr:SseB family protein [Actinomycetota bacterium]